MVAEDLDETVQFLALLGFDCGKPRMFSGEWIDRIIGLGSDLEAAEGRDYQELWSGHRSARSAWRLSGNLGRPSSGTGSHAAARATNWRTVGRMPGSPSKVPIRIPIVSGWLGFEPNIAEPHSPQNHFSPPPSGFHTRRRLHPATMRNAPGAGCACADDAVPVRRWQRLQWQ